MTDEKQETTDNEDVSAVETSPQLEALMLYTQVRNIAEVARRLNLKLATVHGWACKYDWNTRLEKIDRKTRHRLLHAIEVGRYERLQFQLDLGLALMRESKRFLDTFGIESGSVAVSAVKTGAELIQGVDTVPLLLKFLGNAKTDELVKMKSELMQMMEKEKEEWEQFIKDETENQGTF